MFLHKWHAYSEAQIENLRLLILWLAERDGIDVTAGLVQQIKDVGPHTAFEFNEEAFYGRVKGMWTHTDTRQDKTDLAPQEALVEMLLTL
ncbi:MAG: hypothetical protein GKR89_06230 [Candidatus Latescibacteria bacterium]|nr:hypothetical protein [Candidatus Latescibacterota bacterium]